MTKILYVEDEHDIQVIAQMALEIVGGFEVAICGSGMEALQTVADFAPDIILLDVMMPDMDGIQTYQALRRLPECAATPVVFMTAKVQASEVRHYLDLGAVAVIPKPFDPMALANNVKAILSSCDER
jgi:two-component system OmpR family response regulator